MARPPEKLARSLAILRKLQTAEGAGAIRARDLSRTHRERLLRNGFLQEVIKGWYIPSRPDEVKGESTAWYEAAVASKSAASSSHADAAAISGPDPAPLYIRLELTSGGNIMKLIDPGPP